ncbi:TPA: hypothetical protein ACVO4S_003182 [Vibrio diabolicus]
MTQNIEQRTLAATATMEGAAKSVDEIANTDKVVETPVGYRDSFPKISRESKSNFEAQLLKQDDDFQKRFAVSETAIAWQSNLTVSNKLQRYYTGAKGTESYAEHLPEPSKLPFDTGATFEDDVTNGYWIEHGVASVPWTENYVGDIAGKEWKEGIVVTEPKQIFVFKSDNASPAYNRRYFAPKASAQYPVTLGATPLGDSNFEQWEDSNAVNVVDYFVHGAVDDTAMLRAAFADAAANKKNVVAPHNRDFFISSHIHEMFDSVQIDFNGSQIHITEDIQHTDTIKLSANKSIDVRNLTVDAKKRAHRPLTIFGASVYTNVNTESLTVKDAFGKGEGTLGVSGVRVVGNGANLSMNNTNIIGVDSELGRSNTQGVLAGRGATSTEGYENIILTNTVLKNITEGGGASVIDSDGIKVFGYSGVGKKTNCTIENVKQVNDSGLSCKRIIKTQVSMYDVSNISGEFSNCTLYSPIDNQYGAGSCKNVDLLLEDVDIPSVLIGMPRFAANEADPNDSASTAENISVIAKGNTHCQFLSSAFLADSNRAISRSYKNWTVKGLTYNSFSAIESDNDDSFAEFRNINLKESICLTDHFLEGTDSNTPLEVNYVNAVFENVTTDKILKSVGKYAGNSTVWTRINPVLAINATLQFGGHEGRARYTRMGKFDNGMVTYKARTASDLANSVGRTVLNIHNDEMATKFGYQFIEFKYKSVKSSNNISNVKFTVVWTSASDVAIKELDESFEGVGQLNTPSASFNEITGELEITFGYDPTTQQQLSLEINSTMDFSVNTIFNNPV